MKNNHYIMSEDEKYFFDLNGYLIVRNVLTTEEVNICNEAIEHFSDRIHIRSIHTESYAGEATALKGTLGRQDLFGMLSWPPPYRDPFRKLLIHPMIVSRLNELCGSGFRLDTEPFMIGMEKGTEGGLLHGAGEPFSSSNAYHHQNGHIFSRGVIILWALSNANEGDGGFVIVPGSHKSRYSRLRSITMGQNDMGLIEQPLLKAGDILLFSGSATHGTLPWKGEQPRRVVLYKYSSRSIVRAGGWFFAPERIYGNWTKDLPPEQQAVLYGPGHYRDESRGRIKAPIIKSDGEKVWVDD